MSNLNEMLEERGSRYGKFLDHACVTTSLKAILRAMPPGKLNRMEPDQIEALDMICHKIGRIMAGDPSYEDSWRDIAGYATLVADRLLEEQSTAQEVKQ